MSLQRFEGASLEAVLEDVRDRLGADAAIVEANRLRRGGVAGFFAREHFEVLVDDGAGPAGSDGAGDDAFPELPELPELSEVPGAPEPPEVPEVPPAGFEARLLGMAERVADGAHPPTAPAPSTESADFAAVLESIVRHTEDTVSAPAAAPAPARLPSVDPVTLARIGLPDELCRPFTGSGDPARWLASLLEHTPRPARLPRSRGSVIAAVGHRAGALELARQLAADLRLDPDVVVLAAAGYRGHAVPAHRRIASLEAAGDQRRSWRRRPHPTVVAVEAGPAAASADWARRVLDTLEPAMTWAAVEASRKPEDVTAWSERLGGVDALSVTGVDETVSPAAVLRCAIPVGRLEGRPATPALWGALLAERLAA